MKQIFTKEVAMKKWHVAVLVGFLVGLGSVAFAFGSPFGGGHFCAGNQNNCGSISSAEDCSGIMGGAQQYLNLSKEQVEKMNKLKDDFLTDTKDLRATLAHQQTEIHRLFTDPDTDKTTLLERQKAMSVLHQKLIDRMIQNHIEMREILTPEQLEKLSHGAADRAGARFAGRGMAGCQMGSGNH
jgi:Spy/CpxP family protein refolding chaperone